MTDRCLELIEAYTSLLRLRVKDRCPMCVQMTLVHLRDELAQELGWTEKQVQDTFERRAAGGR